MREILFRGKRTDSGEWVYGNYCIAEKLDKSGVEYFIIEIEAEGSQYYVIPETVGQYTGLLDKNGKRIFEGDIVKTKKYGKIIGHSNVNGFDIFVVIYESAMFRLENTHRAFNLVGKCGKGIDYEIIGNVHDNPELLEVEDNDR